MLYLQRFAEEGIGEQVDLADRKIVGGAPPRIDLRQFIRRQRRCAGIDLPTDEQLPGVLSDGLWGNRETVYVALLDIPTRQFAVIGLDCPLGRELNAIALHLLDPIRR